MGLFNWQGKPQCRCTFDVKHPHANNIMMRLQCIYPTGHPGIHMDQYGNKWWNRNAFMEEVSRGADNPNAQSVTGRRKIYLAR